MKADENPWIARFEPLLDRDTIFRLAKVTVAPLVDLEKLPPIDAENRLYKALKKVFYPTNQCVTILQEWVGMAHAHCVDTYPSKHAFLAGIYDEAPPLPGAAFPMCLTGPAGQGKSELLNAFGRIQQKCDPVCIDHHHDAFPLERSWLGRVQSCKSPQQLLSDVTGLAGKGNALTAKARSMAFRDGVPFVGLDEFQYVTLSSTANTLVSQILLAFTYLGLPWVFAANYSLLHKLIRRPQEDKQRLLARPRVLLPDPPDSEDWIETLRTFANLAPEILIFDPVKDAETIYLLSAGSKRLVTHLILIAYRIKREREASPTVRCADLESAFGSRDFRSDRIDVECIARQTIEGRMIKPDLWCPVELFDPIKAPKRVVGDSTTDNPFIKAREERVAEEALKDSLNKREREALKELTKEAKPKPGKVVRMPRRAAPTAEELKKNANKLRDKFS